MKTMREATTTEWKMWHMDNGSADGGIAQEDKVWSLSWGELVFSVIGAFRIR